MLFLCIVLSCLSAALFDLLCSRKKNREYPPGGKERRISWKEEKTGLGELGVVL